MSNLLTENQIAIRDGRFLRRESWPEGMKIKPNPNGPWTFYEIHHNKSKGHYSPSQEDGDATDWELCDHIEPNYDKHEHAPPVFRDMLNMMGGPNCGVDAAVPGGDESVEVPVVKHTQGPWKFDPENCGVNSTPGFGLIGEDGYGLGVTVHCKNYEDEDAHELAHLIAAAPELLKVLEDLVEAEWMVSHDWGGDRDTPLTKARAAIAKAKGVE